MQRQANTAAATEAKAQATLRVRFPQLPLEARPLSEPVLLERDEVQWRTPIKDNSDVLQAAQLALKKAELTAARAGGSRARTIGVFTASEGAGSERVFGLSVSIPLGGTYREQSAREAQIATQVSDASSSFAG